jgi:LmbE family N-acetylglucosaminyl deacetylase
MHDADLTRRSFLGTSTAFAADLGGMFALGDVAFEPKGKTLLAIGAHMDDSEWGAGGLMLRAVQAGMRVVIVQAVSDYSNWPHTQGREKKVEAAVRDIARDMGVEKIYLGYKYHFVPADNELKVRLSKIVDEVKPDIAILMAESDHWTDHTNIARAGKDAVLFAHGYLGRNVKKPRFILSHAVGANQTFDFSPDIFVDTTDVIDKLAKIMNALHNVLHDGEPRYVAQTTLLGPKEKGYPKKMDLTSYAETLLAANRHLGEACGTRFAEAFQSIQFRTRELWEQPI